MADLDMDALLADLRRDEGLKLDPYKDTLGHLTVGYGHELKPGEMIKSISMDDAETILLDDVSATLAELDAAISWWRTLAPDAQRALANQSYELGVHGVLAFAHMLAALKAHDYADASVDALTSKWAQQVPERAARIAALYRGCA